VMNQTTTTPTVAAGDAPANVKLLDVHAVAARYSANWRTIFRWADSGLIPAGLKIGGRRLFRLDEIENHIRGGCKPMR
jgi:hypothetical protein